MAAKINNLNWKSVALEGIPMSVSDQLQGFIGLEECTDYSFDNSGKKPLKKKQQDSTKKQQEKKRKELAQNTLAPIPSKKIKLSNGFLVETCHSTKPSSTNEASEESSKKKRRNKSKTKEEKDSNTQINLQKSTNTEVKSKKKKPKLGENLLELSQLTLQDMDAWSEFQIPEEIIKALAEQGFKKPTKIQEISLPSAMLGRRDILGAAETGSGKTLAFGIPILTGIMRLKEKAQAGVDVYDMPYKKSSAKQKEPAKKVKNITFNKKSVNKKKKVESSEDGYGSGSASEEEEIDVEKSSEAVAAESTNSSDVDYSDDEVDSDDDGEESADEEFVEEYDVPIRKKKTSIEDDNSNDSDGYIHLSEMLDSDDLANSSDEEHDDVVNPNDDDEVDDDNDDEIGSEDEELQEEVVDENLEGIGCVKVIDNIDMPGHNITKTGKPLYALILTPTRELAMQVSRHLISAAKYTGIRVATIVGGMAAVKQERVLSKSPEIVVATPGRLWELLRQGQTHLEQLDHIKFLAIDETDRMVERNHFEELHPLLERLNSDETRKSSRQNFVFSATLTMVHDLPTHMKGKKVTKNGKILNRKVKKMTAEQKVKKLVEMIGMTDPKVVDITQQNLGTADSLTECRITCGIEQKDQHLYYVLKRHPGRTIVFCNSIGSVKRLAQLFSLLQCHPLPLHASMPQRQRLKNLERFRDDPNGVLVATDVAARGLDIPNVDHVIHYQVPRTAENYVHRSGRTARANKEGLTILMMEPGEAHLYSKICRTLNKTTELPTFPTPSHVLGTMKEIVTLARELDVLQLRHRRVAQEHGWLDKAAREMDMLIDEDFVQKSEKDDSIGKALQIKKKRLENLIAKPLFPKGFSYKYPTLNDSDLLNGRTDEKALAVMKKAIKSGEYKKQKRKSKNAPLLNLEKVNKKALELGKKRQK